MSSIPSMLPGWTRNQGLRVLSSCTGHVGHAEGCNISVASSLLNNVPNTAQARKHLAGSAANQAGSSMPRLLCSHWMAEAFHAGASVTHCNGCSPSQDPSSVLHNSGPHIYHGGIGCFGILWWRWPVLALRGYLRKARQHVFASCSMWETCLWTANPEADNCLANGAAEGGN